MLLLPSAASLAGDTLSGDGRMSPLGRLLNAYMLPQQAAPSSELEVSPVCMLLLLLMHLSGAVSCSSPGVI